MEVVMETVTLYIKGTAATKGGIDYDYIVVDKSIVPPLLLLGWVDKIEDIIM